MQNNQTKSATVAATPAQAEDTPAPWGWGEPWVWTERMLTRLTSGESADRVWFSLLDKTDAPVNLPSACETGWRNDGSAGDDGQTVAHCWTIQGNQRAVRWCVLPATS